MGIGFSTSVIALALKDKGETDYEIHTVEQFDKCVKLANELIPEELKKNITIHKSDVEIWKTDLIPYEYFSIYKELPEQPEGGWDMILVDGSGPFLENGKFIELPNGDVMKMLLDKKIKAGTLIAWDGRLSALKTLERYFGDNFYITLPEDKSDFNVIERKDNDVKFEDVRLKMIQRMGYLKGLDDTNDGKKKVFDKAP